MNKKKVFIEDFSEELDNILKSLKDITEKVNIENFNGTELLDLGLKILEKLEKIKLLINRFLKDILPGPKFSIDSMIYITYIKSNQLIKDNRDSNPSGLEEIKKRVQEILLKLKSSITTMNIAESKYYGGELLNLGNQLLKIELNKQI